MGAGSMKRPRSASSADARARSVRARTANSDQTVGPRPAFDRPSPSSPAASATMRANRDVDTGPELRIRRAIHARGLRYYVHRQLRIGTSRVRPDLVFPRLRVAVFVDGCFWHSCPVHRSLPRANADYWLPKLEANVQRDRRATEDLIAAGWCVMRFWEHADVEEVADEIAAAVRRRGLEISRRRDI